MQHLSLRLVWHDRAWDGHLCDEPRMNVYCQGQFSVQGDYIKRNKKTAWEQKNGGGSCAEVWTKERKLPPCTWTINAFSQDETPHVHIHPFFANAKPKLEIFPEYSAGTWAMDQMYDPRTKKLVADFGEREENIKEYFSQFEEGKSLVFFYLNYDNPIEAESKKYVLVGISRLKKFGPYQAFDGVTEWQMQAAGNRVWSRFVKHSYSATQGVRIPYQEYLKAGAKSDKITPIIVDITGELERRFKYVTRPLSDDDACEIIQRTIESIRQVKKDAIAPGDWNTRLEWLNKILSETWKGRGLYPGLSSVLEVLGMKDATDFVKQLTAKFKGDIRDHIFKTLEGKSQEKWGKDIKTVWDEYSIPKRKLLHKLCKFDLTSDQVEKIISEKREQTGIVSGIEAIVENPYCISEEYSGDDEDDVIGFYRIDNGLFPPSSLSKETEMDLDDPRRLRALMIEKLRSEKNSTGNCFLELTDLIDYIEKRQVDWRKVVPTLERIKAKHAFYGEKGKLAFFEHDGRIFVYLAGLMNDEISVRDRILRLLGKEYGESHVDWADKLTQPHKNIPESVYSQVLEQQAASVENSFRRKLSVITGAAGTGKTTVLRALIKEIKSQQPGATFLLLAPTGKAKENLADKTGMHETTMTIHRALMLHGWLSKRTYRYVQNKQNMIEASNIILDEASMIDIELLAHLFRAIQWATVERLILVGDRNQLPPIGFGRPFFDIVHFLEDEHKEVVKQLTINCRQIVQQTNILKLASMYTENPDKDFDALLNKIEKGEHLGDDMEVIFWEKEADLCKKLHNRLGELCKEEAKASSNSGFSLDDLLRINKKSNGNKGASRYSIDYFQILSPYRGEYFGTNSLNTEIQTTYRQSQIENFGLLEGFTTCDKVIQVVNNTIYSEHEPHDVYNGQLGYAFYVPGPGKKRRAIGINFPDKDGKEMSLWYAKGIVDRNLELGYAITVHKAQGSEFEVVFLVLPREETGLITKELLYTALTRSKKKLVLLMQKDIMPLMAARHGGKSAILLRNTSLFKFRYTSEKFRANDLIHRTSKGEYVRSKSELAIANILFSKNIYYKYEDRLYSKDKTEWKLPDFTIRTEDGDTYYWEHLGRLENDPQYAEDWEEKKQWYNNNGYFDRLIWSDEIGGFDSKKIEKLMKERIGV